MYRSIDYDVIVVGAGLSGLSAAYTLLDKDPHLNVLILEAQDRIGGRIYTPPVEVYNGLDCFDLGCDKINRDQKEVLNLVEKLNLGLYRKNKIGTIVVSYKNKIKETTRGGVYYFLTPEDRAELRRFVGKVEKICSAIQKNEYRGKLSNITMYKFIRSSTRSDAVRTVLEEVILRHFALGSTEVSLIGYLLFCITSVPIADQLLYSPKYDDHYFVEGGLESLCDALVDVIGWPFILRNSKVTQITQYNDVVELITDKSKTYLCRYVIVAVPPNEIANIDFFPPLPKKINECLNDVIGGLVTKFVVTYPTDFWRRHSMLGIMYNMNETDGIINVIHCCQDSTSSRGHPALSGIIMGHSRESLKHRVVLQLVKSFGEEALTPIAYSEKVWDDISGSVLYCWPKKEQLLTHGRIYFAGSETSRKWYGQIEGAVEMGCKTAFDVLYQIRPTVLDAEEMEQLVVNRKKPKWINQTTHDDYDMYDDSAPNWLIIIPIFLLATYLISKVKPIILCVRSIFRKQINC